MDACWDLHGKPANQATYTGDSSDSNEVSRAPTSSNSDTVTLTREEYFNLMKNLQSSSVPSSSTATATFANRRNI